MLVPNTAASMAWFRLPFLRKLAARGHRTWVVAPEDAAVDRIVATGASFLPLHTTQGWAAAGDTAGSYVNAANDVATIQHLYTACRMIRPDLVLSYTAKMAVLTPLAARAAGVPHIHGMVTGLGFAQLSHSRRAAARKLAFHAALGIAGRLSESIILLNPDNMDAVGRAGFLPPERLYWMDGEGVDAERFDAPAPTPEAGALTFLMVARLVRYKGVAAYAEAARSLRARYPRSRFLLAGGHDPGPPDSIPLADLEAWRREGIVEQLGHVSDMAALYAQADAFVLPSDETEGLPVSILEAMAMRRPVVTTAVPGNREAVEDGLNGFVVPPRDARALTAALQRLLDDPTLVPRMGEAGRQRVLGRFDHHIVDEALLAHLGL